MNKYQIPKEKPTYDFVESEKIKKSKIYILIDRGLTVYGFLLVFAYSILLLFSSFPLKWGSIVLFIIFWLMLTYIAFPRLHSFFANMYLPDYFLARTKTGDGILGDPVNFGVLGTEDDIHIAMKRAGWTKADPITIRSSLGIVLSTIKHTTYPEAPVSSLYLFGNKQDFAYQMEVNGSATRRHHVRFWKVPEGWTLPGGKKVDWLAAGTFDKGVGLSAATLQVTHKIDKKVDKERDFIIESILYEDNGIEVDVIEQFTIPYCDENGGGDSIETDGNMPIVNVNGALKRAYESNFDVEKEYTIKVHKENENFNKELPPKSLLYIGGFIIFKLILISISLLILFFEANGNYNSENVANIVVLFGTLIGASINLLLYFFILKKYKWSRLALLIAASIGSTLEIITLFKLSSPDFYQLLSGGIAIAIVLALSSLDIRQWVYIINKRGQ